MYFVILIEKDSAPTLYGPYCSVKSAIDIIQGPIGNVPVGSIQECDETYYYPDDPNRISITLTTATKAGCTPL